MKNHPFHKRVGFALTGLREGWQRERSFRVHVVFAAMAFAALCIFRPSAVWWALFALTVATVLALELLNGALEALIDHMHPDLHENIRIVKDMAAASVLVVAMAALGVAAAMVISIY